MRARRLRVGLEAGRAHTRRPSPHGRGSLRSLQRVRPRSSAPTRLPATPRQRPVTGARHDRGQRQGVLRIVRRDQLRHHPAQRGADDVGAGEPQHVQQGRSVGGHVVQQVGAPDGLPSDSALNAGKSGTRPRRAGGEPTSRLSKRDLSPMAASCRGTAAGQRVICAPRPMISSSGSPSAGPVTSYSISIPLA